LFLKHAALLFLMSLLNSWLQKLLIRQTLGFKASLDNLHVLPDAEWIYNLVVIRTLYVTQRYTQGGEDVKHVREQLVQAEKQV